MPQVAEWIGFVTGEGCMKRTKKISNCWENSSFCSRIWMEENREEREVGKKGR